MDEKVLSEPFEKNRAHLKAVAFRMLGSSAEAEDAVQEAWIRLSRAGSDGVENLGGWMTTVVARVCLDMLRSRKSRKEEALQSETAERIAGDEEPERDRLLADSVGLALHVVLETLPPAERVAFVLHDMFDLSFDEIAPIVNRAPAAARQLASRARRRVKGAEDGTNDHDHDHVAQRRVVDAFLTAARGGDLSALLAALDPNVVVRVDAAALAMSAQAGPKGPQIKEEMHGPRAVVDGFANRAHAARAAMIGGTIGAAYAVGGTPRVVFDFTIDDGGKIIEIALIGEPEVIAKLDVTILA